MVEGGPRPGWRRLFPKRSLRATPEIGSGIRGRDEADGAFRRHRLSSGFLAGLICGVGLGAVLLCAAVVLTCGGRDDGGGTSSGSDAGESPAEQKADHMVVARAGRRTITPHDIKEKIRLQYTQMMGQKGVGEVRQEMQVLEAMVDQYSWVEIGERRGIDKDPDFKAVMELNRKYYLADRTVQKLVYEKSAPTEDQIKSYYDENPDQFHLVSRGAANLILLRTQAEALKVRAMAEAGQDFADLARRYSTDEETRAAGGDLGTVTDRSTIRGFPGNNELNRVIMPLRVGEISAPVQTDRGWCLFRMRSFTPQSVQPLDSVRVSIQKKLTAKRANEIFSNILESARREAGTAIDTDAWMRYVLLRLDDDEVLQYAAGEKNPRERVRIYETLAAKRPQGKRAAQALFMAGWTLADQLRDYPKAKVDFQSLLDKYPQSDLAESARWMVQNMEKGLENLPEADQIRRRVMGS